MNGVTQTILVGDGGGRPGNCLQAAVATLLDLPLGLVPHFAECDGDYLWELRRFLGVHGWRVAFGEPVGLGMQFGQSPRKVRHAVAVVNGEVWDPHPSREGLLSVDSEFVLIPLKQLEKPRTGP